jgi:hypothetical protein
MVARLVASWLALALLVGGPFQPLAGAQAPAQPVPAQPAVIAPVPPPPSEEIRIAPQPRRPDAYDVGAGVVTVLKTPFNVALCAIGGAVGVALFAITFGSGYDISARAVEEGCAGPWVVRGDDLRPQDDRPAAWSQER